jgi:hypothetical protein
LSTDATSGAETAYPSGAPELTFDFSQVFVIRSIVFYAVFYRSLLVLLFFLLWPLYYLSFDYVFWLSIWHLQTFLFQITLPTGTKVTFNYGGSWINGISITPSILDASLTGGLCGIYNGNQNDDFIPRSGNRPTSLRKFAASWQYVFSCL